MVKILKPEAKQTPMDDCEIPITNFDLIIVGTGLPESIIAAAASSIGKKVIQLDPNPFYGTHYSSLNSLSQFNSFLQSQSVENPIESDTDGFQRLVHRPLYSEIISQSSSELGSIGESNKFNIDLSGPRVFLNADSVVELIRRTGISQYMEFKGVGDSFISDAEGNLKKVPTSRSAIFSDPDIIRSEKFNLNQMFKSVEIYFGDKNVVVDEKYRIKEQDLERPFFEYLDKFDFSDKLKSIISHAIVLADSDISVDVISTKCGIDRLRLYHSSIGRFKNADGAMMYPLYGQGELAQAFCRRAAVKGCIHVLRMPVIAVLMDESGGTYKGVKLASGQELYSTQLVLAPSFTIAPQVTPSVQVENSQRKVARAICVTKTSIKPFQKEKEKENSIKPGVDNCLVIFPPRSLCPEQRTSVRVLQLSSNWAVAPPETFVTYLSATCDNATEGHHSLNAAITALFSEKNGTTKPCLLSSTSYIQELPQGAFSDSIRYMPMPDEHLHYNDLIIAMEKVFKEICPGEEFFPDEQVADPS